MYSIGDKVRVTTPCYPDMKNKIFEIVVILTKELVTVRIEPKHNTNRGWDRESLGPHKYWNLELEEIVSASKILINNKEE